MAYDPINYLRQVVERPDYTVRQSALGERGGTPFSQFNTGSRRWEYDDDLGEWVVSNLSAEDYNRKYAGGKGGRAVYEGSNALGTPAALDTSTEAERRILSPWGDPQLYTDQSLTALRALVAKQRADAAKKVGGR